MTQTREITTALAGEILAMRVAIASLLVTVGERDGGRLLDTFLRIRGSVDVSPLSAEAREQYEALMDFYQGTVKKDPPRAPL